MTMIESTPIDLTTRGEASRRRGARAAVVTTDGTVWTWEDLYREFAGPIAGYARSRGVAAAEDLTQEVLKAAVERLDTFHGNDVGLRSWLFGIAHRRIADHYRRSYRRPEVLVADHEPRPATGQGVDERLLGRAEASAAFAAFSVVTERERTVLSRRILDEVSPDQVAKELGITSGNVRVIQARALRKIRAHLAATGTGVAVPVSAVGIGAMLQFVRDMGSAPSAGAAVVEWLEAAAQAVAPGAAISPIAPVAATGLAALGGSKLVAGVGLVVIGMSAPTVVDGVADVVAPSPAHETMAEESSVDQAVDPAAASPTIPLIGVDADDAVDHESALDPLAGTDASLDASVPLPSLPPAAPGAVETPDVDAEDGLDVGVDLALEPTVTGLTDTLTDLVGGVTDEVELPLGLDPLVDDVLVDHLLGEVVPEVVGEVDETVAGTVDTIEGVVDDVDDTVTTAVDDLLDPVGDLLEPSESGFPLFGGWGSGG